MTAVRPTRAPEVPADATEVPARSAGVPVRVGPVAPAPGLQRAGARLPVDDYTRRLWDRRWFVAAYSSASNAVGYEGNFLGQAWQLLTPLLNIGVYYLVFGLLLHSNKGVPNYIAFLAVGVFVFAFSTQSLTAGAKSITGNLGLVRAIQFPRAVLPMSTTLVALMQLLYSLIILIPIVLLSGEPITWRWVLLVPAIALQSLFCLGLAFFVARIGALVPDMAEILPFISRLWMYTSGVMYSVAVFTQGHAGWIGAVMTYNPGSVFLELARNALLVNNPASPSVWLAAVGWAGATLVLGYLHFWRGEEEYGNV